MKHQFQTTVARIFPQDHRAASVHTSVINDITPNFDLAEIQELAALPPALTASIFLPTHRVCALRHQDHALMKTLLNDARRQLVSTVGEIQAAIILAPALAALDQADFWNHPGDGLVLFCRADSFRHRWTLTTMPALAVVSEHCHLKPLMPLLQDDGRFYVLELTQHGVHLHSGSRFSLLPLELPGAPASVEEAPSHLDPEHHTEVRTLRQGGYGAIRYFGTAGDESAKLRITDFFRQVDVSVCAALHGHRAPLVIAGVEYLLPLYHAVNRYPHLLPSGLGGNPDLLPTTTLHERAWNFTTPHFCKAAEDARNRFALLRSNGLASDELTDVLRAAFQGRLGDLFIASDHERWGTYDPATDNLREHNPRWPDDDDLLNLALIAALKSRTNVQVLPCDELPNHSTIAANFRY